MGEINFGATGKDEIIQNVNTIIATIRGTVPLYRNFGLDGTLIDRPINVVKHKLSVDTLEAIRKYEPRAKITITGFKSEEKTGKLIPEVEVDIVE